MTNLKMEHWSSKQVCFRGYEILLLLTVVATVSATSSSPCISETIDMSCTCRSPPPRPPLPCFKVYNITPPVTPERQTSDKFPLMFVSLPCSLVLSLIVVALINNYKKPTYQVKTNISTCTKDNAGVFPVANCRLPFRGGQNESTEEGFNVTKDTAKLSVGDDQPGTRTSCMSYDNASYAHLRATVPTGDQQDFDTVISYNGL